MQVEIHKNSWFKSVFTHGKWYILASLFTKGIGLILLPVYTRYLSSEDYGVLSALNSIARFLPILISLYLDSAFGRFFHDYKKDSKKTSNLFSTVYWFVLINGIVMVLLIIFSSRFWLGNLIHRENETTYALLAFIPPLFLQIGTLGVVFLRQSLLAKQTTLIQIASTILTSLLALYLLIIKDMGVIAILSGGLLGTLFIFLFYTFYFIRKGILVFSFNKHLLKICLLYSIPLIPNIAGGWIAGLSDRLIIAKYDSLANTGLYSIGFNIAFILYIISDSITQVIGPVSMSGLIHDKTKTLQKIANTSILLLSIMLLAHLGLTLFSKEIIAILTEKSFHEAFIIVPVLSFPYVISSQQRLYSTIISYHKKTWVISVAGILSAFANLGLNILLVPKFGYISAAYATIVSTLAYFIWVYFWSQRFEKVRIDIYKVIKIMILYSLGLTAAIFFLEKNISFAHILSKILILGLAVFLIARYSLGMTYLKSVYTLIKKK